MGLRRSNIDKLESSAFDVLIVGGGINGAVSAAALAAKGSRVALIDKGDFAGLTSMNSSNLAWGGIKYLESYEFGLVRKLCRSRNQLLKNYPSTVQEIRFLTTISKGFRHHRLTLWLGTWLYWLIGNCFTRTPRLVSRAGIAAEEPSISTELANGVFEYSDAYLHDNDSRFVFGFIRSAMSRGCIAANYIESLGSKRQDGLWFTRVRDVIDGRELLIRSKVLVNAAGPFVDRHNDLTDQKTRHRHLFSKGVHLIVDRITPSRRVLAFFAADGRLFFAIPMGRSTCIGTTDTPVRSPSVTVTDEDRRFILDNINKYLKPDKRLTNDDVIATRCGVRPLVIAAGEDANRDFLQLSRKHAVEVNEEDAHISIFGGKLTDCINVGNEVCTRVESLGVSFPYADYKWYGEPPEDVKQEFFHRARLMDLDAYTSPQSHERLTTRLWRRYGAEALELLESIREDPRQAEVLIEGTEYLRCEIYEAARREMVTTLDDFLRRRSKIVQVTPIENLKSSSGLMEACEILFGERAKEEWQRYFGSVEAVASAPIRSRFGGEEDRCKSG